MSESAEKPVVYILHGDDSAEMDLFIKALVARLGDPSLVDLNYSRFDGRSASEEDLRTSALAIPFLAERRLVVLDNAGSRLGKGSEERFKPFLSHIPATTAFILVVTDEFALSGKKKGWQVLPADHWLLKWQAGAGGQALYRLFHLPAQREMPEWIRKKAAERGGKFNPSAARALADHTGSDTQYALQEIDKLLTYVDYQRMVEPEDVELLTAPGGQVNIFDMVDALGEGNTNRALRLLHALLDETDPLSMFGMIVRQFRLILQAREILDAGIPLASVANELGGPQYTANKVANQATGFSAERLRVIYHRLLELDEGIKSSQWPGELALEMFIAEMKVKN